MSHSSYSSSLTDIVILIVRSTADHYHRCSVGSLKKRRNQETNNTNNKKTKKHRSTLTSKCLKMKCKSQSQWKDLVQNYHHS